jgi:hypothetical protein
MKPLLRCHRTRTWLSLYWTTSSTATGNIFVHLGCFWLIRRAVPIVQQARIAKQVVLPMYRTVRIVLRVRGDQPKVVRLLTTARNVVRASILTKLAQVLKPSARSAQQASSARQRDFQPAKTAMRANIQRELSRSLAFVWNVPAVHILTSLVHHPTTPVSFAKCVVQVSMWVNHAQRPEILPVQGVRRVIGATSGWKGGAATLQITSTSLATTPSVVR